MVNEKKVQSTVMFTLIRVTDSGAAAGKLRPRVGNRGKMTIGEIVVTIRMGESNKMQ